MSALNDVKKSDLRTAFKKANLSYLKESGAVAATRVVENLKSVIPEGARVGAFRGKSDEINIDPLFEDNRWFWAFPRIQKNDGQGEIVFYHPHSFESFARGQWDIEEPNPLQSDRVETKSLDFVLVPGVAFDRKMRRLGRGRGFYDRALENYNGVKVGVASVAQIANDDLPRDAHDVNMDLVATDEYVLLRARSENG